MLGFKACEVGGEGSNLSGYFLGVEVQVLLEFGELAVCGVLRIVEFFVCGVGVGGKCCGHQVLDVGIDVDWDGGPRGCGGWCKVWAKLAGGVNSGWCWGAFLWLEGNDVVVEVETGGGGGLSQRIVKDMVGPLERGLLMWVVKFHLCRASVAEAAVVLGGQPWVR